MDAETAMIQNVWEQMLAQGSNAGMSRMELLAMSLTTSKAIVDCAATALWPDGGEKIPDGEREAIMSTLDLMATMREKIADAEKRAQTA